MLENGEQFEHTRTLLLQKDFIEIQDMVNIEEPVEGRLYLHPSAEIENVSVKTVEFDGVNTIYFDGPQKVSHFNYDYCSGFNLRMLSKGIEYSFIKKSSLKIVAHPK